MGYPTPLVSLQTQPRLADPPVSADEVTLALLRVLESPEWSQSVRMAEFLRFVVEHKQQGTAHELKQTVIGVSVFGRQPDYDPKVDPVVRVEARRVRAKLQEYYSGSGAADPIRIDLPKGGYEPHFARALLLSAPAPADVTGAGSAEPAQLAKLRPSIVATAAVAVAILIAVVVV